MSGKNTVNILSGSIFFCDSASRSLLDTILLLHSGFELSYEIRYNLINIFININNSFLFALLFLLFALETSDVLSLNLNSRASFILVYSGQYFNIVLKLHIQPIFP